MHSTKRALVYEFLIGNVVDDHQSQRIVKVDPVMMVIFDLGNGTPIQGSSPSAEKNKNQSAVLCEKVLLFVCMRGQSMDEEAKVPKQTQEEQEEKQQRTRFTDSSEKNAPKKTYEI